MRLVPGEQISCRRWSGAKSPIDGKMAYLEFFHELQIFSAPELQVELHRVQKKGATDFFAVTFTNIDGFS